jgi:uncharacterized damage-inducible protein DinB
MASLLPTLRGMLAYTIWADRQVLRALAEVPERDLTRDTGTAFGSVLGTMAHVLGAEQLWLSRFLGVPLQELPSLEDFSSYDLLRSSYEDFWPQLEYFLASLTEEQSAAEFSWRTLEGEARRAPYRQVLLHFANHATYHRGQVVAQLRQLGRRPPETDLVNWRGDL